MPADNTDELGSIESDQIAALRNELEEKNEELRVWRLRCMQAEAEVRALKRGTKHTASSLSTSQTDNEDPVHHRLVPKLEASAQTEETALNQKHPAGPCASSGVSEVLSSDHSEAPAKSQEMEELRHQLQIKNSTIIQLQADMIREQQVRDKQTSEKQRRAAESQQMCREELREMTQRAESLSEQVRKSKKKTQELQSAREVSADECTRARSELELCEQRLRMELSVKSELQFEQDALKAELTSRKFSENLSEGREEAADKTPDVIDSQGGRHGKLLQCIESLRQMQSDISKELQPNNKRASRERPITGKGSNQSKQSVDEVLQGILKQLQKVQRLATECNESHREPTTARIISSSGFDDRASSPEHERPIPETAVYLRDRKQVLPSGEGSNLPAYRDEVQGRLDISELRLELETQREKLITDHCEELDDLVRRHDQERQVLYSEISEWRVRFTNLQAEASVAQPILEMQHYFETQVSVVRQELVAQLADIQERQSVQRGHEVQQLADLRHCLERCQTELSASQHEFQTLATLFEKERQRTILKAQQQERDFVQEAFHELAESGATPVPSEPANMATLASTRDFCPDEEATVATDMLSIFAAAANNLEKAEGTLVAVPASGSTSPPVLKQSAPRVPSSSSMSMLRGAVPPTQNRPISPDPSKSASPTSSMSSVAAASAAVSATQMRKIGTGQSPASLLQYTDRHSLTT